MRACDGTSEVAGKVAFSVFLNYRQSALKNFINANAHTQYFVFNLRKHWSVETNISYYFFQQQIVGLKRVELFAIPFTLRLRSGCALASNIVSDTAYPSASLRVRSCFKRSHSNN